MEKYQKTGKDSISPIRQHPQILSDRNKRQLLQASKRVIAHLAQKKNVIHLRKLCKIGIESIQIPLKELCKIFS